MAKLSDIEDGFTLKRRREKGRAQKKKPRRALRGEHTIPPPPAKHILASFTLANPTSKRAVSDYVETQARGEKVLHAEKVKSERILGSEHDCWDVHTEKDRYWVITSPSNLYSQRYFPSLDFTLSFHVGVTARILARSRGAPDDAQKARLTHSRMAPLGTGRRDPRCGRRSRGFSGGGREVPRMPDSTRSIARETGDGPPRRRCSPTRQLPFMVRTDREHGCGRR